MVELEKIASLLEGAHEEIAAKDQEILELKAKNEELESAVTLEKEAADHSTTWDSQHEMGSAVDGYTAPDATASDRLDSFLND